MACEDLFTKVDRFINEPASVVRDTLLGYISDNPDIAIFDYGNVVVRRDYLTYENLKIISGGASGHEPAFAGYVGKGMLTAAVQGNIFASPSAADILKTIREVTYRQVTEVLLIVQNNTGNLLNFGLACERARKLKIMVKMFVVSEESCVVKPLQGRRGLSGIILLIKIAGAMAENGDSLDQTLAFCKKVQRSMSSILFSLSRGLSPTNKTCVCSKSRNDIEIATGWHGETGLKYLENQLTVTEVCSSIVQELTALDFEVNTSTPIVILINNLGNILQLEEQIFVKELLCLFHKLEIPIERVYHGYFLTVLDMKGFTLTILKLLDLKILEYLDAPCEVMAWGTKKFITIPGNLLEPLKSHTREKKLSTTPTGPQLASTTSNSLLIAIQFVCEALISCEKQLNTMDLSPGNNNCGSKLKLGAETLLAEIKHKTLMFKHPCLFFEMMSSIVEKSMGGTSGAIYGMLLEAASNTFRKYENTYEVDDETWLECLHESSNAIKGYLHLEDVFGTLYDPLHVCATTIEDAFANGIKGMDAFKLGLQSAECVVQKTKQGLMKYPDPGAHGVGNLMERVTNRMKWSENTKFAVARSVLASNKLADTLTQF